MALRFRRSIKLAPGIRMNLSGSGVSWTLGPRGASVGIGRRRASANVGIPGTGLSFNQRVGGASSSSRETQASDQKVRIGAKVVVEDDGTLTFKDEAGSPLPESWVEIAKKQNKAAIQGLIQSACEKVNGQIEALGEIHLHTPPPTEAPSFVPVTFMEPKPLPPIPRTPSFFQRFFKSKVAAIELANHMAQEQYTAGLAKWQEAADAHYLSEAKRKMFLEEEILSNEEAMEMHLSSTLQEIVWPRETDVSFDVSPDRRTVRIEVDLPEIEEMPKRTASVPSRGMRLSVKEMSSTQIQRLYMRHVHGVGFRIIGEAFAALQAVQVVHLSAYSQRANKATGQITDEYLYSVRVARDQWSRINFGNLSALDIVEAFTQFELRRQMTKTGVFKPIEPVRESAPEPR